MKIRNFTRSLQIALVMLMTSTSVWAQTPASYLCSLRNDSLLTSKIYEFDIYLQNTDGAKVFELSTFQAGILVSPSIVNGGIITAGIVASSSQLVAVQRPTSITYTAAQYAIKLAARSGPGMGAGTVIPSTLPGIRVVRIRLTNTVDFGQFSPNFSFNFTASPYNTVVSVYDQTTAVNTNITNAANHTTTSLTNPVLNAPITLYTMTGGGSYCSGAGVAVGLSGSELGVQYRLVKNASPIGSIISGTGSALAFGIQPVGTYTTTAYRKATNITAIMSGSSAVTATVVTPTITGNATPCLGSTSNVYTSEAAMTGYTWTVSAGGTITAGGTSTDNTVTVTWNTAGAQTVSVNYTNGSSCTAAAPTVYGVTVSPTSVGGTLSPATLTPILLGGSTETMTLTGYTGSIIKWQLRLGAGAWVDVNNTTATFVEAPNAIGTWEFRAVVQSGSCTIANSSSSFVTVSGSGAGAVTGGTTPICIGSATGTMTLSGYTGTIIKWQKSLNGGVWTDIVNTTTTYSETPSSAGTWDYRAVVNNGADQFSAPMSIVVNSDATISLTSAASTNAQSLCINSAITSITYAVGGGGTGAGVIGLPTGVTGTFNAGVFTISGTPSVSGNFSYTVTTTGTCVQATTNGTMTVNAVVSGVSFTLGATSTICQAAGTVNYIATATNATGITYTLDAASLVGGNTIVAGTGSLSYAAGWSGTTLIIASAAGCGGPITTTHAVTVSPSVTNPVFNLGATSTRCQGAGTNSYTATASNSTGITYALDGISLAAGNSINTTTGLLTFVAGWSGASVVTASAAGCNGPLTATHTVTTSMTVAGLAFTSGAASTRCQGAGTVTYGATATNSTGITYSLDATTAAFPGNAIVAGTGAVTYAAGWSGTSVITASATGCNGPITTNHTVTITPTVSNLAFILGATSTRCQGAGTVTYGATASNTTGITYSLDATTLAFTGNSIVAGTGAVTYAAGWSGTSVITASAAGCNGPITTTHTVTITPTVSNLAFTLGATSTRCQGAGTVTYTATASNSTGITYALDAISIAGGNSVAAATGVVTYAAGWSGTSIITASAAGCNGPITTILTVTSTPTVNNLAFTLGGTSTRCQGAGSITYTATATNSTGIIYTLDATTRAFAGNSIVAGTGAVTYAAGWSGTSVITASAAGCNGPITTTHTVTITPTVSNVAFTLGATSTRCQGAGTVTYGATATTTTGITYTLDGASITGGNSIVAGTGAVTYVAGWSGTSVITASAAGCNGPITTTHTVTITPTVSNLAFTLGTTSTRCQGAGTVTYTATATNSTGITYTLDATSVAGGNSIVSGTGVLNYAAGWSGTSVITASAAGCNGPITTTHTVTTTPTVSNVAFTLGATSTRCQGAGTVSYGATATTTTGITYTLDGASITGGNSIVAGTGAVSYAAGWSGTSVITASAAGCNGPITTLHTVTITPTVSNVAFTLGTTSTRCQGAGTVTYGATASNTTGITYSLDATTLAFTGNSIVAGTGAVTYAAGWSGTSVITASAAGCNGPITTTHTVTITPTVSNLAFTLGATSTRCQGAGTVLYSTTANNTTGITYTLDASSIAGGNSVAAATGIVTYAAGWSGTSVITASAAGCNGPITTTHTVTTTPTVTNLAFTLGGASTRCQGAGTVTYGATATNSTGITYTLDATTLAFTGNTIVASTGAVTYAAGWSGTSVITASAAGCNGPITTTHTVTITPTVSNLAFTLGATSTRCQGAGTVTYGATATTSTGITYSLDATTLAFTGNSIVAGTGAVTYAAGWSGTSVITASAAGCNGPITTTHTVTVTPTVGTPVFTLGASSTRCQSALPVTYTATATNSTGISYSLDATSIAGGNSINSSTGVLTYIAGWSGSSVVTASAAGCNGPSTAIHTVTTTPTVTNLAFTAGSTSTICQGAGTVIYGASATNTTGITYTLDAASVTGGNTIVAGTGAVTFAAAWSGTTVITASAAGCNGPITTTHTVTITPTVSNLAFTLGATSTRCQGAGTVTYGATASNSTGITYSLDATTLAFTGNSIVAGTGAVTYAAGWSGTSVITASAAGCNGPITAIHTVTVTPTVGTPVFTLGTTSTRCQAAGTVTYTATATNNTGITYTLDATSIAGGNSINSSTGVLTYVAGWSGTSTITASAAGCNGPKTADHIVTITPIVSNLAFTAGATSTRCQGAGSVTYDATASNSTGITYSLDATSVTGGNTINAATGAVTYAASWNGTSTITATAAGCTGTTATHTVTINATSVGGTLFPATLAPILLGQTIETITLSGYTGTIVKWQESPDGTTWTDEPVTATTYSDIPNAVATWQYRVVVQNGICPAVNSSIASVVVSASAVGSVSGVSSQICLGSSTGAMSLSGNTWPTIVRWERSTDLFVTIETINSTANPYSEFPASAGTWKYRAVTFDGTTHYYNSAPTTIVVDPTTVAGSVTGGTTICSGSTSGVLALGTHVGAVTSWQSSLDGTTWADIAGTAALTSYTSGALTQTTQFRAMVQSGTCTALPSASTTVTVNATTVGGTVGGGTTICSGSTSAQLSLTGNVGSVIGWQSSTDGFNTFTPIAITGTTYTSGVLTQTTQFRAVVQSGSCLVANSATTTVTVDPTSVGGTVTGGTTICNGSTSGVLTLAGNTGTVVRWESSVSPFSTWTPVGNAGLTTFTSGAISQTTQFRAVVQSGTCAEAPSTSTTVMVDQTSVGGTVTGVATNVCSGSTSGLLTLAGHTGNVIKWQSSVSPFTTWNDIVNTGTTYTSGALTQTTEFRAVVQSGTCSVANSISAVVTVDPTSVGGTVTGGTNVCMGSTSGTLTLGGQTGTVTKWQSSVSPFTIWNDIVNTGTTYTSGALTQTTQFRAVVQSGTCSTSTSATTTVTVDPTSVGGTVTGAASVCMGSTSGTLTLAGHTGTIVKWQSSVSPYTTWSDIVNTTTTYTSGALTQATQFRAVVQSGSCSSATSAAVTVGVDPTSVGGTVTGGTAICSGSTSGLLTLAGNTGSVSKWQSSTDGTTWSDIASTAGLSTYTSVALTQTTYFRAVVQSGTCSAANSSSTAVTVDPTSVGGTIAPADLGSIFLGQPISTMTLSGYTGTIVKWRERLGTGTWIDEANASTTYSDIPNAIGTWEYQVAVQSGTCPVVYSTSSFVVVQASNAGAVTGGTSPICQGTATGMMTLAGYTGTIVKWQKNVDAGTWSDIANTTTTYSETPSGPGKWEYRAVVRNITDMFSAPASVVVDPTTVGGTVTGGATICNGSTSGTLTLSGHTGAILRWESSTDGTNWSTINNTATTYSSGALSQTTQFRAVVQSGTCNVVNSLPTMVTVSPTTVGGTVTGGTAVCTGSTSGLLTLSGQTGNVIKWQSSVSPFNVWSDIANTNTTYTSGALTQSTEFRAVVQSGSCSVTNSAGAMVTVDPTTVGGTVSGGTAVCTGSPSGLLTLAGHTGSVVRWESSTDGTTWSTIANSTATYTAPALTQTTQFRAVVQSGSCSAVNSATTTVTVDAATVAGTLAPATQTDIPLGQSISLLTLTGYTGTIVNWHEKLSTVLVWSDEAVTVNTYSDIPNAVGTWQYQVIVKNGSCPVAESNIALVNVIPSTEGAVTGGSSPICLGSSTGTMTLAGNTGTIVKWQQHVDGGAWSDIANTTASYTAVPASAGIWEYRAIVRNAGDLPSAPATIEVDATTVGGGVAGGGTICNGSTSGVLTLSGQTGAVVKWQSSTDGFNTFTDIANTATTYTSGVLTQTTQFRAVVQSGACLVANALAATVTVSPTSVGGTVTGGTTVCNGSTSGVLTLAGHTGTVTKWQSSTDGNTWSDIANTATTYTSGALTVATQFRAVVQSGSCSTATSVPTTVSIDPTSVGGTVTGVATNVCSGSTSGLLTLSGKVGTVIKWQSSVSPFTTWNDIVNTGTTYTSGALTQTTEFRAVVQSGTCSIANSISAVVTVDPTSTGGSVTGGTNVCLGSTSGTLTLVGHTGTVMKWQSSVAPFANWVDIANTSANYTSGALTETTQFRAVVQSGTCSTSTSAATTVTVDPTSVGGTVTGGTTICMGSTSGTLTLAGHTGTVVKWQSSVSPYTTWSDIVNTSTTYTSGALTQATQFRAVVQSGSCLMAISAPTTVSIDPTSVGGSITGPTNVCLGNTSGLLTLTGNVGVVIKWQSSVSPFTTWNDIVNTGTSYISGALTQTTEFRAVVQSGSCSVTNSVPLVVAVSPTTVGGTVTGATNVCSGSSSGVLTLEGQTGSVVRWESSVSPFTTWTPVGNTGSTSYTSGALTQTTQFRAVVQSGSCLVVNSAATTVTVDPTSVGGTVLEAASVCMGSTSGVLNLAGHTGTVVKWQSSVSPYTIWSDINNTTTTYTSGPLTQDTQFRAVVQSGNCSTATSAAVTVAIDLTSVGGVVTGGTAICSGSNSGLLTLAGNTGSVSTWQSSTDGIIWSNITATSGLATYTSGALTQTTWFRAVVKSGNCSVANSSSTLVTVDPVSVGGSLAPANLATIFLGQAISTINLAGYTGTIVKWQEKLTTDALWSDEVNTMTSYFDTPNAVGTWEYRAVIQSGICSLAYSSSAFVIVQPSNAGAVTGGSSQICLGSSTGTMTLGSYTGTIVKWQEHVNGGAWSDIANTTTTYSTVPVSAGVWEYRAVVNNISDMFSAPTTISVDPSTVGGAVTGGATICNGSTSGTLSLSGHTGAILKWQSSTNGTTWIDIANTAATYSSGALSQTTQFRAVVQSGTCEVANSASTTVTVSPTTVGGAVTGGTAVCTGSTSGQLILTGSVGTVIKWQSSVSPFSVWSDIANTSTSYTSGTLTQSTQFRAVVQSGSCSVVNSAATMVTVDPTTVGGNVTGGTTVCTGSTSRTLTLAGHTGAVVKWQSSVSPFTTWSDITNTASTYISGALTQTTQFRAVVQSGSCAVANSTSTTVTVDAATVAGTLAPATQTDIYLGQSIGTLTLSGYTGLIVNWHEKLTTDVLWSDEAVTINTYADIPVAVGTWQYQVNVQNGSCPVASSNIATVNVLNSSEGAVVGGVSPICLGTSTGTMTLTGYSGTIVRWEKHLDLGPWIPITNTTTTYSEVPASAGIWQYRAIVRNSSDKPSAPATIEVSPASVGGSATGGTTICSGSTSSVLTLSGQTGTVIKWQSSTDGFNTFTDIANTATTHTSGVLTQTTQFRAVVQSGSCSVANSLATTVTVTPTSVGGTVTGGTTICTGSTSGLLTLSGYTGTIVKWQSSVSPFSVWNDIANTATTYTSGILTQATQFRAVVQSGGCSTAISTPTTVSIYPISVGGTVTGATNVCSGSTSGTLTLAGQTGTVIKWQQSVSPFTTWNDIANTATTYTSGALTQTTEFRAVVQSGSCSVTNSVPVSVRVDPISVGGVVTGGTNVCFGSNSGPLTLSGNTGNIIKWQSSVDGFVTFNDIASAADPYISGALTETTQFRAVVQSGSCSVSNSIATTVTVNQPTVGGTITGGSAICLGSTSGMLTLSGNTGIVVKWQSSVSPFNSWNDIPNTATTYTSGALTQTTQFRAVLQSGSCSVINSSGVTVTVNPTSVGGVVTGGTAICSGSTSGVLTLAGQTGSVTKWQSSVSPFTTWTDIANTTNTLTSGVLTQTTQFRAVVQSGSCSSANSSFTTVTVDPVSVGGTLTPANLGTIFLGQSINTITISGYTGTIVRWRERLGTAAWFDETNTATSYSDIPNAVGTWEYQVLVQSGSCSVANSSSAYVIVLPSDAGAVTGGNSPICQGSSTGTMTLGGYTGAIVKWQKHVNGGLWSDIANTAVTYSEIPASAGIWEYRAVINNGSVVYSAPTSIDVDATTVGGAVTGGAIVCNGSTSGTLTLSGHTGTVLKWQSSTDVTTWSDIANTATTYISGALTQTTYFRAIVQSGTCSVANSAYTTVTISPITVGGTVAGGATICTGSTSGVLTLSGHTGSVIKWQSSVSPFSIWSDIANTSTIYISGALTQSTQFRAVVQSGSCSVVNSAATMVMVDPTTVGGTVTGGTAICAGIASGTLTLAGHTGAIVKWQSSTDGTTWDDIANTSSTYISGALTQTTQFRAVVQSGTCPIVNSSSTTVTVSPVSIGGTILPATQADILLGQSISTLTIYGYVGTIVKWHEKLTTDLVWSDEAVTVNTYADIPNAIGTWQYQAILQSGNCAAVTSSMAIVNVLTSNAGAVTGGASPICLGTSTGTMSLSGYTGTIVKWQQRFNGGTWTDIANTTSTYTTVPASGGIWDYRAVVHNLTDLPSAPATIDVSPTSVGGSVSGGSTICIGSTSGVLTLTGQTGSVVKWQSSTDGFNTFTDIANTATTYTSGVLTQATQFRAVVQSGSCSVTNSLATTVSISPASVGGIVTGGTTVCSGSTSGTLTLAGYTGSVVKWQSSVSPFSAWTDIANTATTYTSGNLTQTTQFRAVVQSGSCSTATSTSTTVSIDPISVGGIVNGGTTICTGSAGSTLTLSGHTGSILKWQSSVSPFTTWDDIANTSSTYSTGLLTQSTQFRAVVQSGGCSAVNSVPTTVTVSPVTVGGAVTGGTTICSGSTSGLLTLSGHTGTVIKWQSSVDGFSTWSDIPITATTYISGILDQTTQFRAVVQSGSCSTAFSVATTITVDPVSVGGLLTPPTLTSISLGQPIGIITLSGQTGQVVKWQERLGTGEWYDESHTATSYSDIPNAIGTWEYRTVIQSGSCPETYSSSTFVAVGPSAAGAVTGGSASICLGASTGTMTLAGYTGTIVKWQRHVNDGTWSDLANTTTTYSEIPASEGEWEYRAIINNGSDLTSAPTTIIVHPLSNGGTISGSKTICSTNTSGTLTLTGYTGSVVKWQSSVSPFTSWTDIANATSTYVSGALNETTHFRAVVQSGECSSANSDEVVITVIPRAVPTISGSSFVLLASNVVTYTTEAGMTSYIWNVGSGGNITSRGTTTDNTATVTWNSTGNHSISVNYTNEVGCSAGSATVKNVTVALVTPPPPTPPPPPPPPVIPTPTITGGASNGQVCAGTSGIVYTTEANMFNYVWTVSSGGTITSTVTSRSSSITVTWNEAGAQTIGVTYVSAWGGVPKSPGLKTIVVNPLPIPTITGQAIGCAPSEGNVYTTEPDMTGYTWTVSAGGTIVSGSDTNSIIVTWSTTGPQTISCNYTDANGCSANSPTIKSVPVYATPVPTITGISSVCAGSAGVTYTTQPGMNNYIWTVSSGGLITGGAGTNVLTVTWSGTGPQTVGINYTNASGCSAATALIKNVTVNPLPVPTITGVSTICEASTGVSYATESGMTGYNWTISAGGTITSGAGTNNIRVTWNKPGAQTVGVNYTNPEGCTAGLATVKNVTVNPLPGVAGAITGNITLCGGTQNVVYSIAAIANVTNYNWTVPTGATIVSGAGTTSITVNYAASATPGVITVNGSNPCGTSNTSSLSVNVTPLPVAAGTISGNASVCQGSIGQVYTVPPVANATSYTWSVPSGVTIISGANTNSIMVDLAMSATSGQITVYGSNSCAKGTTSAAFNMTVIPLPPTPVIVASGGNVSSSSSQGNQWYFSDTANGIGSPISGANSQVHTPTQNGWYWTQVTINGCLSDVSNRMYRLKAGEANRYNIYPVPNDGAFSISIITPDEQEFNITIYDALGQKIYEVPGLIINGEFIKAIDLRPVSTGVYTVIFRNRTGNMVKKFTVNK